MLSEKEIKEIVEKFDLSDKHNLNKPDFDSKSNEVITLRLDHVTTPRREPLAKNA